ncbi:TCP family transcription factor-like protein, partial [Trifolium medium]|nr:TCP family transcription factor-like protein [Trifolium medium]
MVPVWAIPSNTVVSGGNAFFMVPTNQPQFFTLARPITGFVSSMVTPVIQLQQQASTSSNTCTTSPVMKSPARATVMAPSTAATTTTQMLRDFSLEIYDRQELQKWWGPRVWACGSTRKVGGGGWWGHSSGGAGSVNRAMG